jgi:hypothetical protein
MFKKPTVLIIGAGASHEFNMPLGGELMMRVASAVTALHDRPNDAVLLRQMSESLGPEHTQKLSQFGPPTCCCCIAIPFHG